MSDSNTRATGFSTRCVHAGNAVDTDTKSIRRPLVMANSYKLPDDPDRHPEPFSWDHPEQYQYTRWRTPNGHYLEEKLAALEGGEDCMVAASGVGAISAALLSLVGGGDHVVSSEICYVAIRELLLNDLPKRFGIKATLVNTSDLEAVRRAVTPRTKLICLETPGNPTTLISDIAAISRIARDCGALLMVDSTWSGLMLQHPLELGADLVVHSLSKYVNGHGDALGGAVIGRRELITLIRSFGLVHLGACISPFNAWLIMRGSVTLPMRMERHCANAMKVSQFLETHPRVGFVRYPGLKSHPQHATAARQMSGYSGMLTFGLKASPAEHFSLLGKLRVFTHAVSLGHDESLIMFYPPAEAGQPDPYQEPGGFFRMSVGLEDPEDLIADLGQALDGRKGASRP